MNEETKILKVNNVKTYMNMYGSQKRNEFLMLEIHAISFKGAMPNLQNIEVNYGVINECLWLKKFKISLTYSNCIRIPFWIDNIFKRLIRTAMNNLNQYR